jgi:hypothetical protein
MRRSMPVWRLPRYSAATPRQTFVETDLPAGGLLGENMVIELDYAFPGHAENMFVKTVA